MQASQIVPPDVIWTNGHYFKKVHKKALEWHLSLFGKKSKTTIIPVSDAV